MRYRLIEETDRFGISEYYVEFGHDWLGWKEVEKSRRRNLADAQYFFHHYITNLNKKPTKVVLQMVKA